MRKQLRSVLFVAFIAVLFLVQHASAQNTSPYWSLAGNSNASNTTSKLGTTNTVNLRLYTKNSERMRIDTVGNVGIGTTTVGSRLTVNSASGSSPLKVQINASTKLYLSSGGGLSVGSGTGAPSNGLYVSGNVGVGTATPAAGYKVDVEGGTSSGVFAKTTGAGFGVYGQSGYVGVYGQGGSYGMYGSSSSGTGIFGNSTSGKGIEGTGSTYGVYGTSSSSNGTGVYGAGGGNGTAGEGVHGTGSTGVHGVGIAEGVWGEGGLDGGFFRGSSDNSNSDGVHGEGTKYGVYGKSSSNGAGVYGEGFLGLFGVSTNAIGIRGDGPTGVYGTSTNFSFGVYGISSNTYNSNGSAGVYGAAYYGVFGESGTAGIGVYGHGAYGIYGVGSSWAGYFVGPVYSTGTFNSSDRKLKKNISDFTSAIDIISKLQPKQYEYRQDGNYRLMNLPKGKHYGLIAQDVEQVLPNLVKDSKFDVTAAKQAAAKPDSSKTAITSITTQQPAEVIDFKAVNYTELIPIMVKAIQEQETAIKAKDDKIADLEARLQKVEALLNGNSNTLTSSSAYLEQNTPNPVSGTTTIRFHLPENATSGTLNITNAQGQLVKTMTLASGSGQINLNTAALASGTYNYSLYVDGKQADTKRLLIAR